MRFLKRRSEPAATRSDDPSASTSDPPFVYREPLRSGTGNHVVNDVYARNQSGKKWHRVYRVGHGFTLSQDTRLRSYGRSFSFVCGGAASEFEPDDGWVFKPTPLRADVPPTDEICKACRQSDAKYGRGDIPNTARWDH